MTIVRLMIFAFAAVLLSGCLGEAADPPIVIECFEFEGEEICGQVQRPITMRFNWAPEEIDGKTVEFGERDAARHLLPRSVPIVGSEETGRSMAQFERAPGELEICLNSGAFIFDPVTNLRTQIIAEGECRSLRGGYDLSDAVWE